MDQVYSYTQVPIKSQHKFNPNQQESTRVHHESTPANVSPTRINTSHHEFNLNQHESKPVRMNQHESGTSLDQEEWLNG